MSSDGRIVRSDELGRIWKEEFTVASVLSEIRTRENVASQNRKFLLGCCFKNMCSCGVMQRSRCPTFMHQIRTTKAFLCFGWDVFKQVLLFTELISERKC